MSSFRFSRAVPWTGLESLQDPFWHLDPMLDSPVLQVNNEHALIKKCACEALHTWNTADRKCVSFKGTVVSSSINHSIQLAQFLLNFLLFWGELRCWLHRQLSDQHTHAHTHSRNCCLLSCFQQIAHEAANMTALRGRQVSCQSLSLRPGTPLPPLLLHCHQPQVSFVYHSNRIKLGDVITAY